MTGDFIGEQSIFAQGSSDLSDGTDLLQSLQFDRQ